MCSITIILDPLMPLYVMALSVIQCLVNWNGVGTGTPADSIYEPSCTIKARRHRQTGFKLAQG